MSIRTTSMDHDTTGSGIFELPNFYEKRHESIPLDNYFSWSDYFNPCNSFSDNITSLGHSFQWGSDDSFSCCFGNLQSNVYISPLIILQVAFFQFYLSRLSGVCCSKNCQWIFLKEQPFYIRCDNEVQMNEEEVLNAHQIEEVVSILQKSAHHLFDPDSKMNFFKETFYIAMPKLIWLFQSNL